MSPQYLNRSICFISFFFHLEYCIIQQGNSYEPGMVRLTGDTMAFYSFYAIAIVVLVLHITGFLRRNRLEWLVLVLAAATFPAVIFLK